MQSLLFAIVLAVAVSQTGWGGSTEDVKTSQQTPGQHDYSSHDHGTFELTNLGQPISKPEIQLRLEKDTMSGWNTHITTKHFVFVPEHVNMEPTPEEGHAHNHSELSYNGSLIKASTTIIQP